MLEEDRAELCGSKNEKRVKNTERIVYFKRFGRESTCAASGIRHTRKSCSHRLLS